VENLQNLPSKRVIGKIFQNKGLAVVFGELQMATPLRSSQ
jgi:hypothetical protein